MRVPTIQRWSAWALAWCMLALVTGAATAEIFGPAGADKTADPKPEEPSLEEKTIQAAKRLDAENHQRFGQDADYLVKPGLLANRKDKWVKVSARATGISQHDPVEFFTIPTDSGKDYESLSVCFARPSDLHAALEFIGMTPGRPISYAKGNFWPKGERVTMTFEWEEPAKEKGGKATARSAAAEDLIMDHRHQPARTLPRTGLVFVGSYMITPDDGSKPMYAAEVSDSRSIASDYNDPSTVLDVPHQWVKGQVYGFLKPNPAHRFAAGQPVTLVFRPEPRKDGVPRVADLSLHVGPGEKQGFANLRFSLTDPQGKHVIDKPTMVHALAEFQRLNEAQRDPFVTLRADEKLTLGEVKDLFKVIQGMDRVGGIRVEAPPPGQLYYRAFFPEEEWRDRNKRLGRPWELHLATTAGKLTGELILPADAIDDNGGRGDLKFPVTTPDEVAKVLAEKSDRWSRTVYIFAAADIQYGDLLTFIRPSLTTHETVYIFLPQRQP